MRNIRVIVAVGVIAAVLWGVAAASANSVNAGGLCLTWVTGINNAHDVRIEAEKMQHFGNGDLLVNGSLLTCRYGAPMVSGPLPVCPPTIFDPLRQSWALTSGFTNARGGLVCKYVYTAR